MKTTLAKQEPQEASMLRSILGHDWRKSEAHLLFLSKFLHAKTAEEFAKADYWKDCCQRSKIDPFPTVEN